MSMDIMKNNVAFVASALPANYLFENAQRLNITTIYVLRGELESIYKKISFKFPVKIIAYSPGYSGFASLVMMFTTVKISRQRLYFFHECCCPGFDILLILFNPSATFLPQVDITATFTCIDYATYLQSANQRSLIKLAIFLFKNYFKFYKTVADNGLNSYYYVVSMTQHPSNTLVNPPSRYVISKKARCNSVSGAKLKKILFVVAVETLPNVIVSDLYRRIIAISKSSGYQCYIKNHPLKENRLKLVVDEVITLDPSVPIELIEDDFDWAVGAASTALLNFGERAISIVSLFDSFETTTSFRSKHLLSSLSWKGIFVNSLDDFSNIINQQK